MNFLSDKQASTYSIDADSVVAEDVDVLSDEQPEPNRRVVYVCALHTSLVTVHVTETPVTTS